jgi:hypothetical protein
MKKAIILIVVVLCAFCASAQKRQAQTVSAEPQHIKPLHPVSKADTAIFSAQPEYKESKNQGRDRTHKPESGKGVFGAEPAIIESAKSNPHSKKK